MTTPLQLDDTSDISQSTVDAIMTNVKPIPKDWKPWFPIENTEVTFDENYVSGRPYETWLNRKKEAARNKKDKYGRPIKYIVNFDPLNPIMRSVDSYGNKYTMTDKGLRVERVMKPNRFIINNPNKNENTTN